MEFLFRCESQAENSGMLATWLASQSVQVGLLAQPDFREHSGSDPALEDCLGVKLGIAARFVQFFGHKRKILRFFWPLVKVEPLGNKGSLPASENWPCRVCLWPLGGTKGQANGVGLDSRGVPFSLWL